MLHSTCLVQHRAWPKVAVPTSIMIINIIEHTGTPVQDRVFPHPLRPSEGAVPLGKAETLVGVLLLSLQNGGVTSQSHSRVGIPGA